MKIKLRQIEAFVLAAETLSFSRAADRLAVTRAASISTKFDEPAGLDPP
jgi:Bacterial regulatory helix-turn-helix protein, lysR family.